MQNVGTTATSPTSTFAKKLAHMKTGAEAEVFGAANMTADKGVEFQVCQFDAKTDATTWSIADTDSIANWLE